MPGAVAGIIAGDEAFIAAHGVTNVELPRPWLTATQSAGCVDHQDVHRRPRSCCWREEGTAAARGSGRPSPPDARRRPPASTSTRSPSSTSSATRPGFDGDHLFVERITQDLDELANARRLFEPGRGYSYNNAAFSIAGAVIDRGERAGLRRVRARPAAHPARHGGRPASPPTRRSPTRSLLPHWVLGATPTCSVAAGWQPGWELAGRPRRPAAWSRRSSTCSPGRASSATGAARTARCC